MKWINTKDRLPEPKVDVLAYMKKEIYMARYDGAYWFCYFGDGFCSLMEYMDVTYWMPLPGPPVKAN